MTRDDGALKGESSLFSKINVLGIGIVEESGKPRCGRNEHAVKEKNAKGCRRGGLADWFATDSKARFEAGEG